VIKGITVLKPDFVIGAQYFFHDVIYYIAYKGKHQEKEGFGKIRQNDFYEAVSLQPIVGVITAPSIMTTKNIKSGISSGFVAFKFAILRTIF
jgi:hypothetical protein